MTLPDRPEFIFVYNADSGLFNTATDIAHKLLSPDTYTCNLCALTHGHFKVRDEWVRFLETLDAECEFVHRDEFIRTYDMPDLELPAILEKTPDGLSVSIDAATLQRCTSLAALKAFLVSRVATAGHFGRSAGGWRRARRSDDLQVRLLDAPYLVTQPCRFLEFEILRMLVHLFLELLHLLCQRLR